jgi:ATP synthase subunit 6
MFNPLEQFETIPLYPLSFVYLFDITITNYTLTLCIILGVLSFIFFNFIYSIKLVPSYAQAFVETLYIFVFNMLNQQAGKKGESYFPIVFTLFFFILISNLVGLTFGFTVTAQFILTISLAFSLNFGLIIVGFLLHGIYFLKKFLPPDTPFWLLPFLCVIEVVSYLMRTLSLSVRLFANMLAGHALMHIISSAFVILIAKVGYLALLLAISVILAVMILETGIAFLQAYVFVILFCIYLSESLEISH